LDLANWLVDSANPITPRVAVNQVWQHLFGQGLVRTVTDFGVRGERPTHPELLDHLAREFVDADHWSRKRLIRSVVTSATYRQASAHRPELAEVDPENRLLHRQNRLRVDGEIVRDLTLAASGLLCDRVGGPSVFPPMPPDVAALSYANNFKWTPSAGDDRYRRGMYTFFKRTAPHPNLTTFDCPDSNATAVARTTSNTPLQALVMLNNESFTEAAQALGRTLAGSRASDDAGTVRRAFKLCVARDSTPAETAAILRLLAQGRAYYADHPGDANLAAGNFAPPDVAETASWIAAARVLLNTDEFITRE
jgi:hypothetical protein